jgi:hypothetical protein
MKTAGFIENHRLGRCSAPARSIAFVSPRSHCSGSASFLDFSRVRFAKFAMLQTSEPHAVKGARVNFLCLSFTNWTCRHRNSALVRQKGDVIDKDCAAPTLFGVLLKPYPMLSRDFHGLLGNGIKGD